LTLNENLIAGGKMKETGITHWIGPNVGATNSSGLTGLPGGHRYIDEGFDTIGYYGEFWTITEKDNMNAWLWTLDRGDRKLLTGSHLKQTGHSVRCLKNN
jgi:uncharacterized protein (TIGR02145 family)